ncbi:Diadenosine 5',5'''-P1,P4-tetraphosphate phosphorylase 2 [Neolecta irregularis DAH-3]|uniref:Diadenosine 5',5'''-P1,P4-tetraphosphate phosphorylase 2 n=1 Tax=Neolecta irregularis (strain DAH-3) TaxID=1198029 RepID=A0A1U7LJ37_NEOID|nr:Diadenosine 5',5'''-P1,P4-tetraphosphate phosphorylase 2 [Neolecta irregularis DAH-3]|eukprot:OLL22670.1 Diadenosine 5',5'''-P1,P4-tetraphosphate phosphorylase 2 [Neolecta irregularis DAH-3]
MLCGRCYYLGFSDSHSTQMAVRRYSPSMGSFTKLIGTRYNEALESKHLIFIESRAESVSENGLTYQIRCAPSLAKKSESIKNETTGKMHNPFLPPAPQLVVCGMGADHTIVLNKFCILPRHFLLITNEFQKQTEPLSPEDLASTWECLSLVDKRHLAFFNCGKVSGASQDHKHVQFIEVEDLKMYPDDISLSSSLEPASHPSVPFAHFVLPVPKEHSGLDLASIFAVLLSSTMTASRLSDVKVFAYNFCMTKEWMFMAPRSKEHWKDISINSTGMVGLLLTKSDEELQDVKHTRIVEILEHVGIPKSDGNVDRSGSASDHENKI